MPLPRPASPRRAFGDLAAFFRNRSRHQLIAGALAIALPAIILLGFIKDSNVNTMPGRQIIYAESWPADRSDAEIVAQQKIDQKRKEEAARERQRAYQRLEKRLGI